MSKVFIVYTKWTGYSEIIVEAKNEKDAETLVYEGNYDPSDEIHFFGDMRLEGQNDYPFAKPLNDMGG